MNLNLKIAEKFMQYKTDEYIDELDGIHYIFKFPNNYGASVVKGRYTYGGPKDLWEMALIFFYGDDDYELTYEKDFDDDVKGYLTDEQVNEFLEKILEY